MKFTVLSALVLSLPTVGAYAQGQEDRQIFLFPNNDTEVIQIERGPDAGRIFTIPRDDQLDLRIAPAPDSKHIFHIPRDDSFMLSQDALPVVDE